MRAAPRRVAAVTTSIALLAASLTVATGAHAAGGTQITGWNQRVSGGADVTFSVDTATSVDGDASLRLDDTTPRGPNLYAELNQNITVEPGTTYHMSGWFRGEDLAPNAGTLLLSNDWVQRIPLPGGTYDWQQITWDYEIPAGETVHTWRMLIEDVGTLWIDDLTMTAEGSRANLLVNGSFEDYEQSTGSGITVTDNTLVFSPGEAEIGISSEGPEVGYRITDVDGVTVDEGLIDTTSGTGTVDATGLGLGYYGLSLTSTGVDAVSLDTSFAVVADVPASARTAGSPFGVSFHFDEYAETDTMMGDFKPLGVTRARLDYPWVLVEKQKGVYDFPASIESIVDRFEDEGVRPLIILNDRNELYDDNLTPSTTEGLEAWGNFAAAVADHFGDRVDYEIYNEFNGHFNDGLCGKTPECYYDLMVAATDRIREVLPDATIAGPAMVYLGDADRDWLTRFAQLGGLAHIDAVSFHPYNHPATPEEFQPKAIADVNRIIDDYAEPGHDVEAWVTETGWPTRPDWTTEHEQADYIGRYFAASIATGADRTYWYEVNGPGTDESDLENRFGMMGHRTDEVHAYAPKPGYVAYNVAARMLADADFVAVDNLDEGGYGYEFSGGEAGVSHVLWATEPQDVTVTTSDHVTIVDEYGRESTMSPTDGSFSLTLGERPVYLIGDVDSVDPDPESVYGVTGPSVLPLDAPVDIEVSVDHRDHAGPVDGPVTFRASTGEQILVPGRTGERTSATLTLVAASEPGQRAITVDVIVGGRTVMQKHLLVGVVDHRSIYAVAPRIDGLDPFTASVDLSVTNASDETAIEVTDVEWSAKSLTISGDTAATIEPGASTTLSAEVSAAEPWRAYPYTATVSFADGIVRTVTGTLGFNPVPEEDTGADLVIDLDAYGTEVELEEPSSGPDDLGGTLRLTRTDDALIVTASVSDDVHDNAVAAADMWTADSIQFAFSPVLPEQASSYVEIGAALTSSGAAVQRFSGSGGDVTEATVTVERDEDAGRTDYRVELPWPVTGVDPTSTAFGFSFLVNDADGEGRTGFLEWGSGIGISKAPSQYSPMLVVDAPADPEEPSADAWDATVAYGASDEVAFDGALFVATWWTQGEEPGSTVTGSWQEIRTADDGTAVWTPSRVFDRGDRAWHDGSLYQAAWYSRNDAPGTAAVWQVVETAG